MYQQPPPGYQQPYYPQPPQQPKRRNPAIFIIAIVGGITVMAIIYSVLQSAGIVQSPANQTATMAAINSIISNQSSSSFSQNTPASGVNVRQTVAPSIPTSIPGQGSTVSKEGYIITLNSVDKKKTFGNISNAKAGYILLAVDITIQSDKEKGVSVNPFYCKVKDGNGYSFNFTVFGKDPSLSSQNDLPKGEKMRGWVTFEVPENSTGLVFEYQALIGPRFQFVLG